MIVPVEIPITPLVIKTDKPSEEMAIETSKPGDEVCKVDAMAQEEEPREESLPAPKSTSKHSDEIVVTSIAPSEHLSIADVPVATLVTTA